MNEMQLKRLRQFYHSFFEQQKVFNNLTHADQYPVRVLAGELKIFQEEYPALLPIFNQDEYLKSEYRGSENYSLDGIRAYLAMAIGRIRVIIDQPSSTPITEKREFTFINDAQLREIIERDFSEIQRSFISECWKSVIILCGGAIEAILTDLIIANETQAIASAKAPDKADITRWDLSDLINVAVDLKLVSAGVEKLSHPIREYRNLVHPGKEIRSELTFDAEEAKIALEVLNIVYRDLRP